MNWIRELIISIVKANEPCSIKRVKKSIARQYSITEGDVEKVLMNLILEGKIILNTKLKLELSSNEAV